MAGSWEELGFPNFREFTLKDKLITTVLKHVRENGHPYVDLRLEGGTLIFHCCLCFAPCFGETNLYNHLNGSRHAKKLVGPKETLMKQNPWPFNDGIYFFHVDESEEVGSNLGGDGGLLGGPEDDEKHDNPDEVPYDSTLEADGTSQELVIPYVLQNHSISALVVRRMGVGLILAKYLEKNSVSTEIKRIWCEWLGKKDISSRGVGVVLEHDFAIVTFPYDYNLGRKVILDYPRHKFPSGDYIQVSTAKKRKASSDPMDASVGDQDSESNNSNLQVLISKSDRRRLLDQFSVASERACSICMQKLWPGRDVAALLNRRTGKLACSSRNSTGAFHVFHASCLVRWVLQCEVEMHKDKSAEDERPKKRRKRKSKKNEQSPEEQNSGKKTIYCPDCQGSGIEIHTKDLEKPTISLGEIFWSKINLINAHHEWLESPEKLENCAIGFTFPRDDDETRKEQVVKPLKSLTFYRPKN